MPRSFLRSDLEPLIKCKWDYHPNDEDENPVGPAYKLIECEPTGETASGTDNLGEWNLLVFEVEGVIYRCYYVDGNSYWRAESGDSWDDYFPKPPKYSRDFSERYTRDGDNVVCTEVVKKEIITYTWEPVQGPNEMRSSDG